MSHLSLQGLLSHALPRFDAPPVAPAEWLPPPDRLDTISGLAQSNPTEQRIQANVQIGRQLIESTAVYMKRVNDHAPCAPCQAMTLHQGQAIFAPNHEQGKQVNMPSTKEPFKRIGLALIIEEPEPIQNLAEAMLNTCGPGTGLPAPAHEEAIRTRIFELYEAEGVLGPVSNNGICLEVAK